MELKTNQIRTDGGTQARAQLDNEAVQEYRDILKENGTSWPFPPVVVFHDGREYWLADGFHRIAAARQHGRFVVEADVRQGQQRDAILYAAGANADHGLKRTTEDKQRAVTRLLEDAEWGKWSDREIARRCKVSPNFVGGLRLTAHEDSEESKRTYTTKHGTVATMKTAAIGSKPAPRPDRPTLEERRETWILIAKSMIPIIQDYAKTRDYVPEHGRQSYTEFDLIAFLYEPDGEQNGFKEMQGKLSKMTLAEIIEVSPHYADINFARDAQINITRWLGQKIYQEKRAAEAQESNLKPAITAVSPEEPGLEIWEIESLVRQWHETRPPIRQDALYNLEYFCDWLERNNHNARRNYVIQALNNVKSRGQGKKETAVSAPDPNPFRDRAIATEAAEMAERFAPQGDVVFDYLKQAEKALGRAVSGFDINKGRALFFMLNDSYNKLLNAIHEYETIP